MSIHKILAVLIVVCASALIGRDARAHHSYAMFDAARTVKVAGTVAKFEWTNPHTFIWVYVPNSAQPGKHDLYAIESGSTNAVSRRGWTRNTFVAGEKVTFEFWPLRDGRNGGHLKSATHSDGRITEGNGVPRTNDETAGLPAKKSP